MFTLRPTIASETETLVTILQDALSSKAIRRAMLTGCRLATYTVYWNAEIIGAVAVRWDSESEIELLAVDTVHRGQGIGQTIISAVLDEARRRSVKRMLVGTGNFSLDNIAFYQKCGFHMSHVRRGWFDAVEPPEFWHGIRLRDMIVFDYRLEGDTQET